MVIRQKVDDGLLFGELPGVGRGGGGGGASHVKGAGQECLSSLRGVN